MFKASSVVVNVMQHWATV